MNTLQDRIKARVGEMGISFHDLARRAGISYRTVYSVMNGENKTRPSIIGKIAGVLQVTPAWLLYGTGEPGKIRTATQDENGGVYPVAGAAAEAPASKITVREAVRCLSREFHVPESVILDRVVNLLKE